MSLLVCLGAMMCATVPASAGQHPVPLPKNFDEKICVECHAEKAKGKAVHSAIALGCTTCHEVKTEKEITTITLIAPTVRAVCVTCHSDKGDTTKGEVHPPVAENCTTCHSPHSSDNKNQLLKAASGNESENLCLTCHDKGVRTPEKGSRHAALDMGCDTCHLTHKTGASSKLEFAYHLVKSPPALCLDCHDVTDKKLQEAHAQQPFSQADCTGCHDPHQSESPRLLNKYVHFPFGEKMCDACHQAPKSGKVVLIEDGKFKLCYGCHDAIQKQIESSKNPHHAFQVIDACTECHNPHASRTPRLLRMGKGQVCATCHEMSKEPVRHGPYDQGQCGNCHDPHGTEAPKLLRAEGNALCRGCHVVGQTGVRVSGEIVTLPWNTEISTSEYNSAPKLGLDRGGETGHPLLGHPFSGKNKKSKDGTLITCLTCHQPHSSTVSNLMPAGIKGDIELCEECHK